MGEGKSNVESRKSEGKDDASLGPSGKTVKKKERKSGCGTCNRQGGELPVRETDPMQSSRKSI